MMITLIYMREKMFMIKMEKIRFFIIIIVLIAFDQISKTWIINNRNDLPKTIIKNILDFTYCENRGIAFGIASGHVHLFSLITLLVLVSLLIIICFNFHRMSNIGSIGVAMLIAGGFGNFIDRTFRLYVVDFIDIRGIVEFPIFNIADICVVAGVVLICISWFINCRSEDCGKINS